MFNIFRVAVTLATLLGAMPLLAACHTTAGFGQDMSQGGTRSPIVQIRMLRPSLPPDGFPRRGEMTVFLRENMKQSRTLGGMS